jgi:hypothetical protein
MKNINSYASFFIDNKSFIIVTDTYTGSPLIGYAPDYLLVAKSAFKKYSALCFLFMRFPNFKTKIIKI